MQPLGKNSSADYVEIIGLRKGKANANCNDCFSSTMINHQEGNNSYQEAKEYLDTYKRKVAMIRR